jgi:phosphatidylinositol alpha 1,6-mannosyltransferase
MRPPRVAFFPDSFHEVNGVAHTSRNFQAYAERHSLPFLCVRAAATSRRTSSVREEFTDTICTLELPRSRASVPVEKDLSFDASFGRHAKRVDNALHRFRPDLIHCTGPSELGLLAAYFAEKYSIPLAASWHTNVHEYAGTRLPRPLQRLAPFAESITLKSLLLLYRRAQVLFAPNRKLCAMLSRATGRACHLMQRGVDTQLFTPAHQTRPQDPPAWNLGFVGRLSKEKNVLLLPLLQRELDRLGVRGSFTVIGHGAEEAALRQSLPTATFPGVLHGVQLAQAYANMDLFIFPSHTDTFGNVVLEALASGVPAVVTPDGGPATIVSEQTGAVATDDAFASTITALLNDPARLHSMRQSARAYALTCTWDAVFDRVYAAYESILWAPRP